jgi:hypothetical protein
VVSHGALSQPALTVGADGVLIEGGRIKDPAPGGSGGTETLANMLKRIQHLESMLTADRSKVRAAAVEADVRYQPKGSYASSSHSHQYAPADHNHDSVYVRGNAYWHGAHNQLNIHFDGRSVHLYDTLKFVFCPTAGVC